ncbi:MAG: DNA translocase FtsK [Lentisphaeria bacterium]|jgi:S-DNA-T family DNA segregation ATPase FtsK/SpoIIIE
MSEEPRPSPPPFRRLSKVPAASPPPEPGGLGYALTRGFVKDLRRGWQAAGQFLEWVCIENPLADFVGWLVAVWNGQGVLPAAAPPSGPAVEPAADLATRLKQRFHARQQRREARRQGQEAALAARRARSAALRGQSLLALAAESARAAARPPAAGGEDGADDFAPAAELAAVAAPVAVAESAMAAAAAGEQAVRWAGAAGEDLALPAYERPSVELLRPDPALASGVTPAEVAERRELIQRTLDDFRIDAEVKGAVAGPRVTLYEVEPAPGVKVEAIGAIEKNLAMELAVESLRILLPVPGQSFVGVEVPNRVAAAVRLRGLLEDPQWRDPRAVLPVPVGRDIRGRNRYLDLARAPHLLVAGATGSGKSVCVNSMLLALLFRFSPEELQLLLVDPKVVEFAVYREVPHLVAPVINDPRQVPVALGWVIREMEARYQMLAAAGARNLEGFNKRVPRPDEADAAGRPLPARLPFLVVVIDELADIRMSEAGEETEKALARIAQLSRAVGIHTVVATQRPSVDVLTGVIKANYPTRIAFQVSAVADSRVVLDGKGAECLLGRGDLLFKPPGGGRVERCQAPLVEDAEIEEVLLAICRQRPPRFVAEVLKPRQQELPGLGGDGAGAGAGAAGSGGDGALDEALVRQAVEVICRDRRATTSYIQRRLRIGYNRAALVMEELERRGVVGPQVGAVPREILLEPDGEVAGGPASAQ